MAPSITSKKGQSLIELVIAIAVGAVLVGSASMLISVALRISREDRQLQAASFLSQDLMDKVAIYAERQWYAPAGNYGIFNLNKGASNHYYLCTKTCAPFERTPGDEQILIDGIIYTRYFYVENVDRIRCGIGDIVTGFGSPCTSPGTTGKASDPSTQKVTVVTSWPSGGNVTFVRYLTRNKNQAIVQTDWSGDGGSDAAHIGPFAATSSVNTFETSQSIDYTGTPGSILLD